MQPSFPNTSQLICSQKEAVNPLSIRAAVALPVLMMAVFLLLSPAVTMGQLVPVDGIASVAGDGTPGYTGDGGPATGAELKLPFGIALDNAGNLYIADTENNVVRKVDASTGIITTVAGTGTSGYSGDGGAAVSAELASPLALAFDGSGNLYISDSLNNRIRVVSAASGVISTVAGNGNPGYTGDGGAATSAQLNVPQGLLLDSAGNLYIADFNNNAIREVIASNGTITTIAGGNGQGFSGDGGAATSAQLYGPFGLALDSAGDLYIVDQGNNRVRMVSTSSGIITTVAGDGTQSYSGDGGAATSAALNTPIDVKLDTGGNLYISDSASNRIRMVSKATGVITTVAGNGQQGHSGDGGPAIDAALTAPAGMAFDRGGNLYDADAEYIRKITPLAFPQTNLATASAAQNLFLETTAAETISGFTVPVSEGNKQEYEVGNVTGCAVDGVTSNPAGAVCTVPITFTPAYPGLRPVPLQVVTSAGNVNIGLNGTGVGPLASLTPGTMSTLAGEVDPQVCTAYSGPALLGPLCNPSAGAVDAAGNVYVAAFYSNTVSKIDTSGNITVIAGTGGYGVSGIGGPATSANIERPSDVVVDPAGNVYFADETAQQVFRIDAITQIITSVAGNGAQGYSGDNGPATLASFNRPEGVALDPQGNLYVEDQDNNLIRKIDTAGIITTVAGNPATINQGTTTFSGDGGPATQANLELCCDGVYAAYDAIAVDAAGNLFIGDSGHQVVREVTTGGIIHTVAGNNALGAGYSGDGGAATSAQLNWPMGVAVDPAGDLYIADFSNDVIRKVDAATQTIATVAGNGRASSTGDGGPATKVSLAGPQKVVLDGQGNLYVADTKNNLVRKTDVSNPALTFVTPTPVGSADTADGSLGVVVSDIGNAPLTLPPPSTGTNPGISTGFSLYSGEEEACAELTPSSTAATLQQGSSCALDVNFTPVAAGNISGSLVLTDNSLNATNPYATQTIALTGTATPDAAPQPVLTPATISFGDVPIGTISASQTATLKNTGDAALSVLQFNISGSNPGGFGYSDNCGNSLAAGASCTIVIDCEPAIVETLTASFNANFPSPIPQQSVALTCNGTAAAAPQAALSPATANFGSVTAGTTSGAQTFTLTNAGNAALSVTSISLSGANAGSFSIASQTCGSTLAAGASCSISVTFLPATAGGFTAGLSVVDAVGTQTAALTGTGTAAPAPQAALTPASVNFGSVTTGTSSSAQILTLTNAGNAALSITSIGIAGTNANTFTINTNTCGASLAAGATCTISITFAPTAAGSAAATLSVSDNAAGSPQTSSLTGIGAAPAAPAATLTPSQLDFGSLETGTRSTAQTATLTNTGNAVLTIASISLTGSNSAAFATTSNCGSTLAAGASCTISVTFDPAATGTDTAALSVSDNAPGSPQTSSLTGVATAPPPAADFTVMATPASQSVTSGSSAAYQVTVASVNGSFTQQVALAASGLPTGATVTFAPTSLTPGSAGATSTMTIQTLAQQASTKGSPAPWQLPVGLVSAALLILPFRRGRRIFSILGCLLLLLGSAGALSACGGGFALPQTKPASAAYTVTVTGTSGSLQHSTSVQITVR